MGPFQERFPQFWAAAERVSVVVLSSLLFWASSLFIITIPAAITGLFAAVAALFRFESGDTLGRYWNAFRRSLIPAFALGLMDLVLGFLLYVAIRFYWAWDTPLGRALAFLCGSFTILLGMINVFAWPLLAWYPQPLFRLLRRAFLLAGAHPLIAVAAMAAAAVTLLLMLWLPRPLVAFVPLIAPAGIAALVGFIAWRVMKRYADKSEEVA